MISAPDQASAVSALQTSDAAVVVVGEKAYAEVLGDRPLPRLDADQQAADRALEATGKPVIVVVLAGRPLGLGAGEQANALLMAWQGGTETGAAVADVLFGKYNPSGRLPVTWPSDSGDAWVTELQPDRPLAGRRPAEVLRPAARDLQRAGLRLQPGLPDRVRALVHDVHRDRADAHRAASARGGRMAASVTVTNTGSRAGTDVVQVYATQPTTHDIVIAPIRRLVGFARVDCRRGPDPDGGDPDLAGRAGDDARRHPELRLRRVVQPGDYQLNVGTMTRTVHDPPVTSGGPPRAAAPLRQRPRSHRVHHPGRSASDTEDPAARARLLGPVQLLPQTHPADHWCLDGHAPSTHQVAGRVRFAPRLMPRAHGDGSS